MQALQKINKTFLVLSAIFFPFIAKAAGALDASVSTLNAVNESGLAGSKSDLPVLIGGIISVLLGSLGIVFVIFIVNAGIMYMTAAGDPAKVDKAKKMITQAVVGLIIVVAAYSISSFVIGQISGSLTSP